MTVFYCKFKEIRRNFLIARPVIYLIILRKEQKRKKIITKEVFLFCLYSSFIIHDVFIVLTKKRWFYFFQSFNELKYYGDYFDVNICCTFIQEFVQFESLRALLVFLYIYKFNLYQSSSFFYFLISIWKKNYTKTDLFL